MNEHMTNVLALLDRLVRRIPICDILNPLGLRPCVAGDNQQTSNLFLMLSPKTMELERVSGVNTENPMHGYQIKSVHSDSWLIYAHLLAGGLGRWFARFIFVQNWLHKPPPVWTCTPLSRFPSPQVPEVSLCYIKLYPFTPLGHCSPWGRTMQPRGFVHQQVQDFRLALLSRQIHGRVAWRLLTPELTPLIFFDTYLNYLDLINMCIADFDKCLSFFALAHGYPRSVPSANVKDKDELRNYLLQQKRATLIVTETRPKFRLLQIKGTLKMERDIKHPLKSGNPNTHWICWIWQKRKTSYKARLNLMELHHLLLRGKLFKTATTLAVAAFIGPMSADCQAAEAVEKRRRCSSRHLESMGSLTTEIAQFQWINQGKTG